MECGSILDYMVVIFANSTQSNFQADEDPSDVVIFEMSVYTWPLLQKGHRIGEGLVLHCICLRLHSEKKGAETAPLPFFL